MKAVLIIVIAGGALLALWLVIQLATPAPAPVTPYGAAGDTSQMPVWQRIVSGLLVGGGQAAGGSQGAVTAAQFGRAIGVGR